MQMLIGYHKDWIPQCYDNVEYQVMVPLASFPSEAPVLSCDVCALSQVGVRPDMTLNVAKM